MPRTTQRSSRRLDASRSESNLPRMLRHALRSYPFPTPTLPALSRRAERPKGPVRLGEYLLALGLLAEAQLASALAEQSAHIARGAPIALGDLLVAQGFLTSQELVTVLMLQQMDRRRTESGAAPTALGELLVLGGIISAAQLAAALNQQAQCRQQGETMLLGQILVVQGALTPAMLEAMLHAQTITREQERHPSDPASASTSPSA
jgi:hypothetical protein